MTPCRYELDTSSHFNLPLDHKLYKAHPNTYKLTSLPHVRWSTCSNSRVSVNQNLASETLARTQFLHLRIFHFMYISLKLFKIFNFDFFFSFLKATIMNIGEFRGVDNYVLPPNAVIVTCVVTQYIRSPVSTLCVGQAASMGSLLLAAGQPGERRSLPNARVMIHQPSGGASGQASDIAIQAREILDMRARLSRLYVKHTGHTYEKIGTSLSSQLKFCLSRWVLVLVAIPMKAGVRFQGRIYASLRKEC